MKKEKIQFGKWYVEFTPEDGARLERLCFDNYDLLTTEPESFKLPSTDYGEYETRPVFGYDDCFPSVDVSKYPGKDWDVPDHGEICWLRWKTMPKEDGLIFTVKSEKLPMFFKREMTFRNNGITWNFEVKNNGNEILPFQHVMHPLMKLDEIVDFELPNFQSVYNSISDKIMEELKSPSDVTTFLMNQEIGVANMFLLREVDKGEIQWTYTNGLRVNVTFPQNYFRSIGIWWNNSAYPDEDSCRRNECAFEPIPGLHKLLMECHEDGTCLSVSPHDIYKWQINWKIN